MVVTSVERSLLAKIWHAFHALAKGDATLDRPKVLVFTQSLVSALHLSQAVMRDFQARFGPGPVLFADFQRLIAAHVLEKVKAEEEMDLTMMEEDSDSEDLERPRSKSSAAAADEAEPKVVFDDLCWTLFWKQGLPSALTGRLSAAALHHLWQWFVTFADTDEDGVVCCPVLMAGEELNFWLHYLLADLLCLDFSPEDRAGARFGFASAAGVVLAAAAQHDLSQSELESALREFHEEVVCSLLRKGNLLKKSFLRSSSAGFADIPAFLFRGTSDKGFLKEGKRKRAWKNRRCVLTMSGLTVFSEKRRKGRQPMLPVSKITAASPHRAEDDMTYFQVETESAMLVFKADDLRSRNQWIRDIRFAIESHQEQIDNVHFLRYEVRQAEFARQRAERAQRQQMEKRTEHLTLTNEALHHQVRSLQGRVAGEEASKEQERRRMLHIEVLEAKLHTVTESTKETMARLRREIFEKAQELDAAQQKILTHQKEEMQLRQTVREQQRKITEQLNRNQELDARTKELLAKTSRLQEERRESPKPIRVTTHRGLGAFQKGGEPK